MKIRQGFISNSSSSSFIVIGKLPNECESVLLNKNQTGAIVDYIKTRKHDSFLKNVDLDNVYLTNFISDCGDFYFKIEKKYNAYLYVDGNHGLPYYEDEYDNLTQNEHSAYSDIWILKKHNLEEK